MDLRSLLPWPSRKSRGRLHLSCDTTTTMPAMAKDNYGNNNNKDNNGNDDDGKDKNNDLVF